MNITVGEWNPDAAAMLRPEPNPNDTRLRYVAMSILHGFVDEPLVDTADQARDVIRWSGSTAA